MKTTDNPVKVRLPIGWENVNQTRVPPRYVARIGDLPARDHYSYRGIPFYMPMLKPQGTDYYSLFLRWFNPQTGEFEEAGEVKHENSELNWQEILDRIIDRVVGKGMAMRWGDRTE